MLTRALRLRVPRPTLSTTKDAWVEIIGVAALLAIATTLRFASIGEKSFSADESYSAYRARQLAPAILALTGREDAHPPLYYVALSLWSRTFGADDVALRSLGAIASILTVAGTYWVARSLGGRFIGMLAAILAAVSPFQILAAQEARMYSLLGLLTLVSWAMLLVAVEGRRWGWIVYVGATVLALYTHYFAFLNLVGQGVFVLLTATRSRRDWLVSQLVILGLFLPWLGKLSETVSWFQPFRPMPVEGQHLTTFLGFLSFGGHAFGFGGWFADQGTAPFLEQAAILAPFLALIAFGVAALWKHPRGLWFVLGYLLIPVLVVVVLSLRTNIFRPRYFSFLFPPFAILMAFGIFHLAQRVAPARHRVATLALGFLVLLFSAPALNEAHTDSKYHVFNWRGVATLLDREAGPNDLIVVSPGFDRVALARYFHGAQQIAAMDPYELSGNSGRDLEDLAVRQGRALFRTYAASHDVMWVVIGYQNPQTALVRLAAQLDGIYDVRGMADFKAIRVLRATRHRP